MSASSPMQHLWWRFWWASPAMWFSQPGLYIWAFRHNIRIIPVPK